MPTHLLPQGTLSGYAIHLVAHSLGFGRHSGDALSNSYLKLAARHTGLADDGQQHAGFQFLMIRHRNSGAPLVGSPLHDHMAAALSDLLKTVSDQNRTNLFSGKQFKLTQPQLPVG